ncbi:response regulator [Planomonospora sp. ID91781]|uniref:response regulator transcription factor n=1 Tax=Planomonospora sp. ID91781 TaxID=2738135 RepID=UPI0018C389C8|nr:response regulator transcription factor [Planomonospora sp. ID91781]MBG0823621.1 response regulator [Planomonospora sp. ID91781]
MPAALLVEDDPDHQEILALLLKQAGCRVHAVADGAQVLPMARQVRPDLVVLDWRLPSLPGTEVCRQLRAAPETAEVAVLMVTAWVDDGVDNAAQEATRAGADDFVLKPINNREFHARVLALLKRFPPRP